MIKQTQIEQIKKEFLEYTPLRKIADHTGTALQTVFKITRTVTRQPKPPKEKKTTLKEKNIYNKINTVFNNIYKDKKENIKTIDSIKDNVRNINIENKNNKDIKELKDIYSVFSLNTNNIKDNKKQKQIKVIDSTIKKILNELKTIDYSKTPLKDLTASLNSLTKQRQELTGNKSENNKSMLEAIFDNPESVAGLLKEIRDSKSNPTAYIIKSQDIQA